jgi:hypothetical protein
MEVKMRVTLTRSGVEQGLQYCSIYGLNIFAANHVHQPAEDDPRIIFVQSIFETHACAAHVGSLAFEGDAAEEWFGISSQENLYIRTPIGLHRSIFYDINKFIDTPEACFFPEVQNTYLGTTVTKFMYLIQNDAVAIYVTPKNGSTETMLKLVKEPFNGHEEWLKSVTELYSMIVTVSGDGSYFHAYSQNPESFTALDASIHAAEQTVERSVWFQNHKNHLQWDDEYNLCWKLPEKIDR